MTTAIDKRCKQAAWLCTLVYFASYVMRINFAVMIVKVCGDMGLDKSDLSVVLVGLTVAYGTGQVISGLMGDKIKPSNLLFFGLCLATVCNVAMFFCRDVISMTVVWSVNGFAHSMLWPPMVRLLASNLSDSAYLYSVVRVSWGSSIATILLYLVCPVLLYVMEWRYIILLCAGVGVISALLWKMFSPKIFSESAAGEKKNADSAEKTTVKAPLAIYFPLVLIMLGILSQGILRDGVTNWMPSYMMETFGMTEENSILTAVVPAVFSIVGFLVFGKLQQKLIHNEVLCAGCIFGLSAVSSLLLYFISGGAAASAGLMGVIVGCMHGINLMLISVVPKRFVKYGIVSTISGVLNAWTYIGSAISTHGFAVLAESRGWQFTIGMWVVVSAVGGLICLAASLLWRKYYKENSN